MAHSINDNIMINKYKLHYMPEAKKWSSLPVLDAHGLRKLVNQFEHKRYRHRLDMGGQNI